MEVITYVYELTVTKSDIICYSISAHVFTFSIFPLDRLPDGIADKPALVLCKILSHYTNISVY